MTDAPCGEIEKKMRSKSSRWMNSFFALMPPDSLLPSRSWNEPKQTMGRVLSARSYCVSTERLSSAAFLLETNCQPSKSRWCRRSSRQADSTARSV